MKTKADVIRSWFFIRLSEVFFVRFLLFECFFESLCLAFKSNEFTISGFIYKIESASWEQILWFAINNLKIQDKFASWLFMNAFNDEVIRTAANNDVRLFCVRELKSFFGGCALHRDVNATLAYMVLRLSEQPSIIFWRKISIQNA